MRAAVQGSLLKVTGSAGMALLLLCALAPSASAQAPIILPTTMSTLIGPHAAYTPTSGTTFSAATAPYCNGTSGPKAYNAEGSGCPAANIEVNTDPHAVTVDGLGNVYFIDNSSATNDIIQKYNPRTGLVTVYAGGSTSACSYGTDTKYGDGCVASDNLGNSAAGYTLNLRGRGLKAGPNNDVYIAGYNAYNNWRISSVSPLAQTLYHVSGSSVSSPATGYTDGVVATSAGNGQTRGIAADAAGNIYLADTTNNAIRKITASTGIITTIAGCGGSGTCGTGTANTAGYQDGAPAASKVSSPEDVAVDSFGNIYFSDAGNNVLRVIYEGSGTIPNISSSTLSSNGFPWVYTVAGSGTTTATVAPIAGLSANIKVSKIDIDRFNNIYIGDSSNDVAYFLDHTTGYIRIIAGVYGKTQGTGTACAATGSTVGDGCAATLATFTHPGSVGTVAVDSQENIYITDAGTSAATARIREVLNGQNFGSVAVNTPLQQILTIHFGQNDDQATTNPFVLSNSDYTIIGTPVQTINADNTVDYTVTLQFKPTRPGTDPGMLTVTSKNGLKSSFPLTGTGTGSSVAIDPGAVSLETVSAPITATIVSYSITSGVATLTAANNFAAGNSVTISGLTTTNGHLLNGTATVLAAGLSTAQFEIATTAGNATTTLDSGQASASVGFSSPASVFTDAAGDNWIADTGNNRVLYYNAGTSAITVIAGTGVSGYTGDNGLATAATLKAPKAVTVDAAGNVYIADTGNNVVRRVDAASGIITTFAGNSSSTLCSQPFAPPDALGDGCAPTKAILTAPSGLVFDSFGNLYISDHSTPNTIRVVNSTATSINLLAGGAGSSLAGGASAICTTSSNPNATVDSYGDYCVAKQTTFNLPAGLAIDTSNNLYIADSGNSLIRQINLGTLLTVPLATPTQVQSPGGVAVDAGGNVYVADTGNHDVRLLIITPNAVTNINSVAVSTIAGIYGSAGTGTLGSAVQAQLNSPAGVAATGAGTLLIADTGNNRVLLDNRTQTAYNFGRTNVGASSPVIPFTELGTGNTTANLGYPLFNPSGISPTGYFTLNPSSTSGCSSSSSTPQTLTPGQTCGLVGQFSPGAAAPSISSTYAESNATVANPATPQIVLSGTGAVLTSTSTTFTQTAPASGNPQYGGTFSLVATVTPQTCNLAAPQCAPTGTVTFAINNGTSIVSSAPLALNPTSSGSLTSTSATYTNNSLPVGPYTIVATYTPDSSNTYYAGSSSTPPTPVTVTRASTTTLLSVSPSTSQQFATITYTATVVSSTTGTPTGSVTFYNNSVSPAVALGSHTLDNTGTATYTQSLMLASDGTVSSNTTLPAGVYNITAVYGNLTTGVGDANYAASQSTPSTLTINGDTPGIQLFSKSCNEINVALGFGVSSTVTPVRLCANDLTSTYAQGYALSAGVATTTGGVAGGTITGYTLCGSPVTSLTSLTGCPNAVSSSNFITDVIFNETNTFTPGQVVTVSGATPSIFNIQYTVLAANSTSWAGVLTSYVAVAQGSTTDATVFVLPTNTLTGTLTFACSGLPANSACTFNPTSLPLTPGAAYPAYTPVIVTFFTDLQATSSLRAPAIPGRSSQTMLALLLGWPITLAGLAGVIRFRKRTGTARALTLLALLLLLSGSTVIFSGCGLGGPGLYTPNFTPAGTYPITVTVSNGTVSQNIVVNLTITAPGKAGAE